METKDVISLFCKLGYLFANCDGQYDNREKEFISNFVAEMIKHNAITPAEGDAIVSIDYSSLSFEDTIKDFREVIALCPEEQKNRTLEEFNTFIEALIEVDGEIAPKEQELLGRWKEAIA